jgi:hypothetical protein
MVCVMLFGRHRNEYPSAELLTDRLLGLLRERGKRNGLVGGQTKAMRFVVSTLFLRDLHRTLTEHHDNKERLIFVSGPITEHGVRVLGQIVPVDLSVQSGTYVLADPVDSRSKVVGLRERDGHELHAIVHSHIAQGAEASQASSVDIAAQRRMEAIGSKSIGAIVTLDGHFCFFSIGMPFNLAVYGNGVAILYRNPCRIVLRLELERP